MCAEPVAHVSGMYCMHGGLHGQSSVYSVDLWLVILCLFLQEMVQGTDYPVALDQLQLPCCPVRTGASLQYQGVWPRPAKCIRVQQRTA